MESRDIRLTVEPPLITEFHELLQSGFRIKCLLGANIASLFYDQLGLSGQIVEEKITTIFLNGKPVDDIASTVIEDEAVLALSGAMPGLVGATLRRKSPLASFRRTISAEKVAHEDLSKREGFVVIKLFNILLRELGPLFLAKGIFIDAAAFKSFLARKTTDFWGRCKQILADGKPVTTSPWRDWLSRLSEQDLVYLKVTPLQ